MGKKFANETNTVWSADPRELDAHHETDQRNRKALKKQGFKIQEEDYNVCGIRGETAHAAHRGFLGRNKRNTLCGLSTSGMGRKKLFWIANVGCRACRSVIGSETPTVKDTYKIQDAFESGLTEEEVWRLE